MLNNNYNQFLLLLSTLLVSTVANVLINEIAPAGVDFDWIEFYNDDAAATVDLAGFQLTDSDNVTASVNQTFIFPNDATLAPQSFLVVALGAATANSSTPFAYITDLFRLRAKGETLRLADAQGAIVDRVTFDDDADGRVNGSLARREDGASSWVVLDSATPNESNSLGQAVTNATVHNVEWYSESHSKHDVPLYDAVFDNDALHRLELEFEFEQWNASWAHMTATSGPFGGTGGTGDMAGGMQGGMTGGMRGNMTGDMMPPSRPAGDATPPPMMQGGGGDNNALVSNDPIYVWCTLRYRGTMWRRVGFRWKGNSSLRGSWQGGFYKMPFRLDMDEFEDEFPEIKNMRMFGFKKMTFASNYGDGTGLREMIMQQLFRRMDVPAGRGTLVQVWMDFGDGEGSKRIGIYTMIEDVGSSLPLSQFADVDEQGNAYKPEGDSSRLTAPLDVNQLNQKFGPEPPTYDDVRAVVIALNADTRLADPFAWRAGLERVFDMPLWLRYLAVTRSTGHWDQYGGMTHNYYLYCRLPLIPCTWVTWDGNEVLGSRNAGGGGGGDVMPPPAPPAANDTQPGGGGGVMPPVPNDTQPGGGGVMPPAANDTQPLAPPPPPAQGGGGRTAGALDLSEANGAQWPLIAFARDDPTYFAAYKHALERLLADTGSLFAPAALDAFIDHWDQIMGAELSQEVFPYSTLANGTRNTYREALDVLRSSVLLERANIEAFLGAQPTTSSSTAAAVSSTTATVNSDTTIVETTVNLAATTTAMRINAATRTSTSTTLVILAIAALLYLFQ